MKPFICFLYVVFCPIGLVFTQTYENTLLLGYAGGSQSVNQPEYGVNILTFNDGSLRIKENQAIELFFYGTNASISDQNGKLLFYFNGIDIEDARYKTMLNGKELNPWEFGGYSMPQGGLILPYPDHPGQYILFHGTQGYIEPPPGWDFIQCIGVYYSVIDMALNNGFGAVSTRKVPIVLDTLNLGQLTAVRHANGRDWWLAISESHSNRFYTVLIDPDGVHLNGTQAVGELREEGLGEAQFSPDGTKYIILNNVGIDGKFQYIDTYDFDRCTGVFSRPQKMHLLIKGGGGAVIAPNSRWLYAALQDTLFQFDLLSDSIASTKKVVGIYQLFLDPFPTPFHLGFLAPDDKIYFVPTSSSSTLHVVHNPDEAGIQCNVQQNGIRMPCRNARSTPNFANYRLGPLDGSACDTLGLNNDPKAWYRYQQDTSDALQVSFHDLSYHEPATWSWDFGDGSPALKGVRHPEHLYPQPGKYDACLTVSNTYGSHTHCKTLYLGVTPTDNPVLQAQIGVSPNPFTNRLSIALSAVELRQPVFYLYDLTGRMLHTERLVYGLNEINTNDLPQGAYFWSVEAGGERVKSGKAIKL